MSFYKLYIYICCIIFLKTLQAEDYIFKWYNNVEVLDSITIENNSTYRVTNAEGSWEDSEGYYGHLKCIGPGIINSNGDVELEVFCEGYDNFEKHCTIKLTRRSELDVGIGKAIYLSGSGRYRSFIGKECTYAIKYINNSEKGFYRHVCKLGNIQ